MPELDITINANDYAIEYYDYARIRTLVNQLVIRLHENKHITEPAIKLLVYKYEVMNDVR